MKRCSRCGETKQIDRFHKSRGRKDGLHSWCKDCMRQDQIDRVANLRGNHVPPESGIKRCTKCGQEFPVDMFYRNSASNDGLSWRCKSCIKAMSSTVYGRELGLSRGKASAKTKQQNKVVKYGESVVEAMERNTHLTEEEAMRLIDGY